MSSSLKTLIGRELVYETATLLVFFSSQALDGVAGLAAYIFGPFFPCSSVAHSVGNSMQQFVDKGVADRFFGVVQGVSGDFYVVVVFCILFSASFSAASAKGASGANEFYRWAHGT